MTPFTRKLFFAALSCGLVLLALSARKLANHVLEAKVPVVAASAHGESLASPLPPLPPPTAEDVRQVIARIYADDVRWENSSSPHYLLGDFNGDGSEDLAVAVRAAQGRLSNLNDDLANWMLEDPSQIFVPDPSRAVQKFPPKPPRQNVREGQLLLVVVHGYGVQGWRSPAARQSYLLLNAVGESMTLEKKDVAMFQSSGSPRAPRLLGDVIQENLAGSAGFLFWTGGHYAWYSPQSSN